MDFKDKLKEVIGLMADSFEEDRISENKDAYLRLKELYEKDKKGFVDIVQVGYSNINRLVENIAGEPEYDKYGVFEYIINGLYKHFHTQRVENKEGSGCSYDKSSYIERMTLKAIQEGKNLSLYADYTNVEQIKEDKERQAYWSPTSIKDTNEAIELFFKWYRVEG